MVAIRVHFLDCDLGNNFDPLNNGGDANNDIIAWTSGIGHSDCQYRESNCLNIEN